MNKVRKQVRKNSGRRRAHDPARRDGEGRRFLRRPLGVRPGRDAGDGGGRRGSVRA